MKERPILFSALMVRAILDGRKTQTRRLLKPMSKRQSEWLTPELLGRVRRVEVGAWDCGFGVSLTHPGGGPLGFVACPYGPRGDRLWVRETSIISPKRWTDDWPLIAGENRKTDDEGDVRAVQYLATAPDREGADDFGLKATPSIFMPRWASRLTLEVTGVRVERLQDCSQEDAKAEGVEHPEFRTSIRVGNVGADYHIPVSYRGAFANLWDSINGERASWSSNPFVWVVAFRRVERAAT